MLATADSLPNGWIKQANIFGGNPFFLNSKFEILFNLCIPTMSETSASFI